MIKNEEKILLRCLSSLRDSVDAYCILDTGSTDASVSIAKEFLKGHVGCVTEEPWQNFGYNRTVSFQRAQDFCRGRFPLEETYGLLVDADMVFVNNGLREHNLTAIGYKALQKNGNLEYMNARLLRMDYAWKCVGVTHEYWDGETDSIDKSICYIDDKNDGGCKSDKFTRDRALLEEGLKKEPDNVRYIFYLAQTYSCLNMLQESIEYYKKRIAQGGWFEEVWYSYYSIGDLYKRMGDTIEFEAWMLRAIQYRKERAESTYKLAQHFRTVGQHYKAYHYIKEGIKVPYPVSDCLFIEANVYRGLFDYEASIVEYYTHEDKRVGLRSSFRYLMRASEFRDNVIQNLHFYMKPIGQGERLTLPTPFPHYTPSAVSIDVYPMANVRYINYWMENGEYKTRDCPVDTQNAYVNLETGEYTAMTSPTVKAESRVKGLEDVRLYRDNELRCIATSVYEQDPGRVCQVIASYDQGIYKDLTVLASPFGRPCEKNWIPVPETGMFIYDWYPLRVGSVQGSSLRIQIVHETPPLFQLFRGSACIRSGQGYTALIHFVEYSKPRKYYHCLVELDLAYKPKRVTLPFVFYSASVEYCISFRKEEDYIFYVSQMDANPSKVTIRQAGLEWVGM